jgi:hypothetical protein
MLQEFCRAIVNYIVCKSMVEVVECSHFLGGHVYICQSSTSSVLHLFSIPSTSVNCSHLFRFFFCFYLFHHSFLLLTLDCFFVFNFQPGPPSFFIPSLNFQFFLTLPQRQLGGGRLLLLPISTSIQNNVHNLFTKCL